MLHQIGAGTLGPVFRAYDPERDRLVAIKLLTIDLAPERVHQLVSELEALVAAELTHSGIAAPLAAGIQGNSAYLVQEFLAADSLDTVIREYGPAPPAQAMQLAVQLAGALDFAAVVNVSHGTLHPRDILISTDEARMTGFGVASALEHIGVTPPLRRPYTAPERFAGAPWDRRADVFSLAAILYEMLWGRRVQGLGARASSSLTDLPGANLPILKQVFARALAEDPDDRFRSGLELAAALREAFPNVVPAAGQARDAATAEVPAEKAPVIRDREAEVPTAPRLPLEPGEVEIRAAEGARYHQVESAPSVIAAEPDLSRTRMPAAVLGLESPPPDRTEETARSAVWPLVLALGVGLALGFAAGFGVGNRDRSAAQLQPAVVAAQPQSPATQAAPTTGREFTESAVNEPPKSSPAPASEPVRPVTPPPSASRPNAMIGVATGRLLVRSTPAGARVFVDGRDRGPTPATIRDLATGTHRIRVVREGYATEERRVAIAPSRPSQSLTVALERQRAAPPVRAASESFYGTLSIASRPEGAKVFVDGRPVGSTPMELPQIGAGSHVVRLELGGYRNWSSAVRIVAGETNRVTASLEK